MFKLLYSKLQLQHILGKGKKSQIRGVSAIRMTILVVLIFLLRGISES